MMRAAVITISDSCYAGGRVDLSGPAVVELLTAAGFLVAEPVVVPDELALIEAALRRLTDTARLVVTTGGTGLGLRDVTPEATSKVCSRMLDGLAEVMRAEGRKETPFAALGRGVCGAKDNSLVLNLPGNPRGAATSLRSVLPLLPHALALLAGEPVSHPPDAAQPEGEDQETRVR